MGNCIAGLEKPPYCIECNCMPCDYSHILHTAHCLSTSGSSLLPPSLPVADYGGSNILLASTWFSLFLSANWESLMVSVLHWWWIIWNLISDHYPWVICSNRNGSKFPGRLWFRFHTTPDHGNGSYHKKNRDHWKWASFTTQNLPFNIKRLAPIEYLSSDRIMTWSICRLCSSSRSFTSRCQMCDWTNIHWVAVENPRILVEIWCYFAAIQRILVRSQYWQREVEERLKVHNLHMDHVLIRSELIYLIGAKVAGTLK